MIGTRESLERHGETRAWIVRRFHDALVVVGGLVLALPLIVPFA
ncbi:MULTISPECIES: hypothetical protein [Methylobacterium]|uniref:ABC transporter permease n=1 Tax=Methylobacterium jeotgali TaxID=381630 RepID=A0ABQ4SVP0_9HYPH|nr:MULTISPECIES: hypothetical protein [Methylobacterium]GBU19803.1 hypothetical protein AwMethylo_40180 [Methylobacterium sp.]GJE06538.1 hypothetical protein AOPFMNJM_1858 [Methylobacterium jeotgali]